MPRFDLENDDDQFDDQGPDEYEDEGQPEPGHRCPPPVSGKAIISLVFAVMFCIPLVPGLLAVLFGAAGLAEIRSGRRIGRGYGTTGMLLGFLSVLGWLLVGALFYIGWQIVSTESEKAKHVATEFVRELSNGQVEKAAAFATPNVDQKPLQATAKAMADWGTFEHLEVDSRPPVADQNKVVGKQIRFRWEFIGTAKFARQSPEMDIRLSFDGSDYRVERFAIDGKWAIGGARWGDD